jgi:hypothetical protein
VLAKINRFSSGPPERSVPRPIRLSANRDWIINIECTGDSILAPAAALSLRVAALEQAGPGENPLSRAIRNIIEQRQATVSPGDEPYQPRIRFRVKPDGLRAYYAAYPALAPLQLPMTRETVEPPARAHTQEIRTGVSSEGQP